MWQEKIRIKEKMGYVVRYVWECQWEFQKNVNDWDIKMSLLGNMPPLYREIRKNVTNKKKILHSFHNVEDFYDYEKMSRYLDSVKWTYTKSV